MTLPTATLSPLHRPDGSASYSASGYTIVGAVNGPLEVMRRDELPEEATLEVNIRPSAGVGTPKERHLETLLHTLLRRVLLVHSFPRTLIQLTLQVTHTPEPGPLRYALNPHSVLPVLPVLLQTALLTLIAASLPLATTYTTTTVAVLRDGTLVVPTEGTDLGGAKSLHVFVFAADGGLMLVESEGGFDVEEWAEAKDVAQQWCVRPEGDMEVEGAGQGRVWLEHVVRKKVERESRWRVAA
ncbi:hypothetical protein EJ06DRAFT_173914 [Trichodelitschia bisporula]|uniref:Exoribonuclease phosphorolytic domain-containing protein n=1 Tax=Trichodelitschia bisporula TaxID=703511 RepID=A0A6G1HLX2_9PEZI|nr:hypothetical protein EJ06DRAFT_173914 [Trichodelitschia bisporula]